MKDAYSALVSFPNDLADGFVFTREYRGTKTLLGVKASNKQDFETAAGCLRTLQTAIALQLQQLEGEEQ
jgi:hypothetical protein